jgi:hypothetical protein
MDVRPDGLGSRGIHVELSGGRKLIFRQHINGLGVNVTKIYIFLYSDTTLPVLNPNP